MVGVFFYLGYIAEHNATLKKGVPDGHLPNIRDHVSFRYWPGRRLRAGLHKESGIRPRLTVQKQTNKVTVHLKVHGHRSVLSLSGRAKQPQSNPAPGLIALHHF